MIDIKRLHELEEEVQDTHDKIRTQSWLVHRIIGEEIIKCKNVYMHLYTEGF